MELEMAKEESGKKVKLKCSLSHPRKVFNLGRHSVGVKAAEYVLNEAEQEELKGPGPKKWLTEGDEKPAKKPGK